MKKIGFLSVFGNHDDSRDTYKTMIKYTNIPLRDYDESLQEFYTYFMKQIQGKVGNLSPKLLNKILQKILELFSNVFRHSESEVGLFCSGQFYPGSDKFNFTIVDNGVTIKTNVNNFLKKKFQNDRNFSDKIMGKKFKPLSAEDAIKWALEDKNSSTGEGGLGLSLLMDLISLSKGSIEIISNNGYYSIKNGNEDARSLESSFEGTVVSIQLNTDDSNYYFLKEERKNDNN
jgi:signal transduction histidine kinase